MKNVSIKFFFFQFKSQPITCSCFDLLISCASGTRAMHFYSPSIQCFTKTRPDLTRPDQPPPTFVLSGGLVAWSGTGGVITSALTKTHSWIKVYISKTLLTVNIYLYILKLNPGMKSSWITIGHMIHLHCYQTFIWDNLVFPHHNKHPSLFEPTVTWRAIDIIFN